NRGGVRLPGCLHGRVPSEGGRGRPAGARVKKSEETPTPRESQRTTGGRGGARHGSRRVTTGKSRSGGPTAIREEAWPDQRLSFPGTPMLCNFFNGLRHLLTLVNFWLISSLRAGRRGARLPDPSAHPRRSG